MKKEGHIFNHEKYTPLVQLADRNNCLPSNGTLVIIPTELVSKWESDIEKHAPWLNTIVLHEIELPVEDVASADICLISSSTLQSMCSKSRKISTGTCIIRRIHWHRLFVDEFYFKKGCSIMAKSLLTSLSATHRFCIAGSPLGNSLDDLQGRLSFLGLPPFNRKPFWKNNISLPYKHRNIKALRILRSLLSHVVVRHSKEQI